MIVSCECKKCKNLNLLCQESSKYFLITSILETIYFLKSGPVIDKGSYIVFIQYNEACWCFTKNLTQSKKFRITELTIVYNYTANMCSESTVKTQLKTVKLNYSFFTVIWTSILPYIVQCRSVNSSLQLLHCTWSSNQM